MTDTINIDLEAQTASAGPAAPPWEALDLRPYMAETTLSEIGIEPSEPFSAHQPRACILPMPDAPPAPARPTSGAEAVADAFFEQTIAEKPKARFQRFPPVDPPHWPIQAKMFVAGFVFWPCWWYGACVPGEDVYAEMQKFRCSAMTIGSVAIIVTIIILEAGFRGV